MTPPTSGASLTQRVAVRLVRMYPQPWQERYGDEVLGLIEDAPMRVKDVGEIARGLLVERAREMVAADDRPGRTAAVLGALKPAFAITFASAAFGLSEVLRQSHSGLLRELEPVGLWARALSVLGWLTVEVVCWVRRRSQPGPFPRPFPVLAGLILLPLFFVGAALAWYGSEPAGSIPSWVLFLNRTYVSAIGSARMSSGFWPGRDMLRALQHLAGVEEQVKGAESWVEGCHTMIAQGVPSPLDAAQANLDRWTHERDEALERVRHMGYRARFRS